ncbi:MAG: hydantoinase B/oxoprolinase family protein, partial [Gemmatimonadetes bacterium]|nr:hydantoinase B/oxoprolinase family protein [Gemmatimonadota bacterium]
MTESAPRAVERSFFAGLFGSIADEMLEALVRSAYSSNIKERRDCSTAVFDGAGRLVAQAAAIPVHLGAMPLSVAAALAAFEEWSDGDVVVLNDPFHGGTHLPDVTMVSPIFGSRGEAPFAFLATYTSRLSAHGQAQHQPLGQALREYAGQANTERLLALLLPVQRAAERCAWLQQMVEGGEVFHP